MPFLTNAQRYADYTQTPSVHGADGRSAKMHRQSALPKSDWVNRTPSNPLGSAPSFANNASHPSVPYNYAFGGGWAGAAGWQPQLGFGGQQYPAKGRGPYGYGTYDATATTQGQTGWQHHGQGSWYGGQQYPGKGQRPFGHNPFNGLAQGHPGWRDNSQRAWYGEWPQPAGSNFPLPPAAPASGAFSNTHYGQSLAYSPSHWYADVYQQPTRAGFPVHQSLLTQQFQDPPANNEFQPQRTANAAGVGQPQALKFAQAPRRPNGFPDGGAPLPADYYLQANMQPDNATVLKDNARSRRQSKRLADKQGLQTRAWQTNGQDNILPTSPQRTTTTTLAFRSPPKLSSPRKNMLLRPQPTPAYLEQATRSTTDKIMPRPLLIILDLNGTLLYRPNRKNASSAISRPNVKPFLHYLLSNHHVMIWSSARPHNVELMCRRLFTDAQYADLVAVWARDKLRLPTEAYNEKVQVYKQLSWVWEDAKITMPDSEGRGGFWDQSNTVLIDDSVEKAASEPSNLLRIDEFEGKPEQMQVDVLGQVVGYLDQLACARDVSAFMRATPFVFEERKEAYDWSAVLKGMEKENTDLERW